MKYVDGIVVGFSFVATEKPSDEKETAKSFSRMQNLRNL